MVGLMSKIKYTEKLIQEVLERHYDKSGIKYTVGNIYLFKYNWETDFLVVQKASKYCYEIEIKTSRADFLNDFKKTEKHTILREGTHQVKKYRYKYDPETKRNIPDHYYETKEWKFRPNRFYYCVPENLIKPEEVPDYAGLMYINELGIRIVKEAAFLHKEKLDLIKPLCDKFYYYWKNARSANLILEKKLNEQKGKLNESSLNKSKNDGKFPNKK
jgi:hypothetical protein